MANSNRNRRPAARAVNRPQDEVMEINTGDVIPLFDDELEILEDDKPRAQVAVLPAVSEVVLPAPRTQSRSSMLRPVSKAVQSNAVAPRRPRKDSPTNPKDSIEAVETMVTTSLQARENAVKDAGFSEAFLYVEKGPGAGQLVPVLQGETVVGRSSDSGLQLNHPSVSRRHAALSRRGEQYFLADAGSQNGTYVNWAKISGEVEIFPGDQVSIGSAVVVLRGGLYTSAMRRGVATGTGTVEVPDQTKKWLLGLGVFGAAVGVGVAAVVLLSGNKPAPVKIAPKAATSLIASKAPAVEEPKSSVKPVEAKPVVVEEAKPVVAVAKPEPKPEPVAAKPEPKAESRHEREHKKAGKHERAEKVAAAESAPAGEDAPQSVLKVYETGNVQAAIEAAEQAGATKLATKMKQFNAAYTAGKDALASKDGGGAVTNFNKALKLDEGIDSGWGKLNGEIRGQLANLYVLAGNQAMSRSDNDTAIKAFKAAQGYQPANAEARAKLKELGGGSSKKAAPAQNSRSAADAAFDS
ncbi:MAG: FHA domain-containing protein [Deltaproteobacteria bacterium]|nr:FHA domain-containing protein [Deltaproteobacteria bacterium]